MPECTCPKCVACCKRRPGWFKPGEAEKAAALFEMPLQDFFEKYLVVDYWVAALGDNDINLLMPGQAGRDKGQKLSFSAAFYFARCVFLSKDDRCEIHSAKPYECKVAMGCVDEADYGWHKKAAQAWATPEHQQQVEDLLK